MFVKMIFSAIKAIYQPSRPCTTPPLSADSMTLLKEMKSINDQCREQFCGPLNTTSIVDPETHYQQS